MTPIFDFDGPNLDQGFNNLRAGSPPEERRTRDFVETLWRSDEPYADPDFRAGFACDPDARFWEKHLGCSLFEAGEMLLPTSQRTRQVGLHHQDRTDHRDRAEDGPRQD